MKNYLFITALVVLILPLEGCEKEDAKSPFDDRHITYTEKNRGDAINRYTLALKDTLDNLCYTATKTLTVDGKKEITTYIRSGSNYQVTTDKETKYAYTPDYHYLYWAIKDNAKDTGSYGKSNKKYDEISALFDINFEVYQNYDGREATYLLNYAKDIDFDATPITSKAEMKLEIEENDNDKLKIECVFDNDLLKTFEYTHVHPNVSNAGTINENCLIEIEYYEITSFEYELPDFTSWEKIEE